MSQLQPSSRLCVEKKRVCSTNKCHSICHNICYSCQSHNAFGGELVIRCLHFVIQVSRLLTCVTGLSLKRDRPGLAKGWTTGRCISWGRTRWMLDPCSDVMLVAVSYGVSWNIWKLGTLICFVLLCYPVMHWWRFTASSAARMYQMAELKLSCFWYVSHQVTIIIWLHALNV